MVVLPFGLAAANAQEGDKQAKPERQGDARPQNQRQQPQRSQRPHAQRAEQQRGQPPQSQKPQQLLDIRQEGLEIKAETRREQEATANAI